ncbi:unnamed protein product [Porites lobata]|uniref:Uncharacterized protein n=1 Tax=Porites lobata TaxID=104759 RepID=A0ABN8QZ77_9CNID|nr:unnamed protein product [Porites lobata]
MTTGNALFDRNLADLRLDVFGNVMFLKAPHWSDVSVQFMHGFPRRLIADHHRGLLRGNITVAARISNQAVRSLSAGDIAAFVSQTMVQGLGLTTSELMMARASAIKYAGQREKPTRLLDLTVRFGIDFLTLAPVPRDKLQDLRRKSTVHWNGVLETSADEDQEAESSSSSDESGLSVDWDPREESQGMPATNTDAYTVAVTRHVENLLHCYVSTRQMVTQHAQLEVRAATARPSGSSGMSRRRKQQTPRRKPAASRKAPDQERGNIEQREPEQQEQPRRSPREILVALPGIVATRIPNEDSLKRLEQACQADCTCLGESAIRDSQDNNDENCPYCISTDEGADVARVTGRCLNADCKVCALMNKLDKVTLAALGEVRNTRLAVMLDLAPFIAQCLNSGDVAEERRQVLVRTFCELLCCSKSRLRFWQMLASSS